MRSRKWQERTGISEGFDIFRFSCFLSSMLFVR